LDHYRQRFRHILVDEFQDTNAIQYAWIRLLAGDGGNLFIVGDDDQSIYGWRGARIENIHRVQKDFPGTRLVRLEQNYRSTGTILAAANALISHNHERLGKKLWTSGEDGEPIIVYSAFNEQDEARFVIERIREWSEQGNPRREAAVLYRSNAQSRLFEEALMAYGIPYRVYGGQRFFERAEIKDALAYLRLMENRSDDAAFERVVNTPTRGIGDRTMQAVRDHARERGLSLWDAAAELINEKMLTARAGNALLTFLKLIDALVADCGGGELREQVQHVIHASGLMDMYAQEKGEKGQARVENLDELVNAARGFEPPEMEEELPPLAAFLAHAALEAGEGQAEAWEDCVQLMTLHSAKGLEFQLVFLSGLEEGLFPHQRSADETGRMEEERRLCYVGMTRARRQLYITYAESRRLHGSDTYPLPSRFLREIPAELTREVRPRASVTRPVYQPPEHTLSRDDSAALHLGQQVRHPKFGDGIVLSYEGAGRSARVQVNFESVGSKWLVVDYANLEAI
jgi:DNA helicase-2/ATP-dependent DNA helicase PcrA